MRFRGVAIRLLALVLSVIGSRAALAQSYGSGDQTLTIGAVEFRPFLSSCDYDIDAGGYMHAGCELLAPMRLPEGAHITQMCLYAYDPDAASNVDSYIESTLLPAGGQSPGQTTVPGSDVVANFDIGYGTVCTDNLDYVVHSTANFEHQQHLVVALTFFNSRIGGVRITWHREVSPLPAASSFDDVPLGSQYSQFIEALKASGITAGCQASPPLYCPDRPITRAEMAVYMSLALGLHWPD